MSRSESPEMDAVLPNVPDVATTQVEGHRNGTRITWDDGVYVRPQPKRASIAWGDSEDTIHQTDAEDVAHLRWTFAVILRNVDRHDRQARMSVSDFKKFVQDTCVNIASVGLDLQVVPRTENSKHKVILLVRCPENKFIREYRILVLRRWRQTGEGVTFRPIEDADGDGIDDKDGGKGHGNQGGGLREVLNPTEADRIQLTAMLLQKDKKWGGCGFGNIEHREADADADPRVVSIFPLHNKEWIRRVTAEWKAAFSLKARATLFWTTARDNIQHKYQSIRSCGSSGQEESGDETVDNEAGHSDLTTGCDKDPEDFEKRAETYRRRLREYQDSMMWMKRSSSAVLGRTTRTTTKAMRKLAQHLTKPRDVRTAHEKFLTSMNNQYGERFAFLFAFNSCCSESFVVLIYITMALWMFLVFFTSENPETRPFWEFYLQVTGIVGLLIPCVWGPAFLSRWDRVSFWYSNLWDSVGVTQGPAPNPFYRKHSHTTLLWFKKTFLAIISAIVVIVALVAMCGMNLVIMELEVLVQTAPLCGSWFYETVWKDYIAGGGQYTSTKIHSLGNLVNVVPSCYGGWSEAPFPWQFASDWPGSASWLPRGVMVALVGAVEGLLIGVVYTEVFTYLALKLVHMRNKELVQDYESCLINYTYPFELVGFMAYFWVLAFLFIPGATWLQSWLATHEDGVEVVFNTTANITGVGVVTTTRSLSPAMMVEVWMDDKRFKNEVGPMLMLPVLVGLQVPMLFEYLLPAMCVSWQRENRQTQSDEAASAWKDRSRYSRLHRCFRRWCCTAKCCCHLCRMCRCCVLICNCCMCDTDRGTSGEDPVPAFPDDYDDVQLARDITAAIHNDKNATRRMQRLVVACHPQSCEKDDKFQQQQQHQQHQQQREHVQLHERHQSSEAEDPHDDPEITDADHGIFQQHDADEIIVESMLDPLDLPNEYRKVCIIVLLVCMWSGVNLLIPLIGWGSLLIRFKFNFIRLVTYAQRPVPQKPNSSDSTGGYRRWLEGQIFLSTIVTSLLFCLSTGQLEAWWTLFSEENCQPPMLTETHWKFRECDLFFESPGQQYSAEPLYDESSIVEAVEKADPRIAAPNSSCWKDTIHTLETGCPFAQENLDEWKEANKRTPGQAVYRVVCFVILENLQVILLYMMIKWNQEKDGNIHEKWKAARLAQHSLIADQLFPPLASDKISAMFHVVVQAKQLKNRVTNKQKGASTTGHNGGVERQKSRATTLPTAKKQLGE